MLEQVGIALAFSAFFTESKVGKTGLTVTCDVYRTDTAGTTTQIVTDGGTTAIGGGLYRYEMAAGLNTVEGEYHAVFKTATTSVDQQHIPSMWLVQKAGIENLAADGPLGTKIRKWFQITLRADEAIVTDNAAEITEINADGGSGGGAYDLTTQSQEATRNHLGTFLSENATFNIDIVAPALTAIQDRTDNLPDAPASQVELVDVQTTVNATATSLGIIGSVINDIFAKTTNLPTDPADASVIAALIDALPTAAEIDAQLSGTHGAGQWEGEPTIDLVIAASTPALTQVTDGGRLNIHRGDYHEWEWTLGNLEGRAGEKLVFTIKPKKDDDETDALAYVQMSETTGVVKVNQEDYTTPTDGSMVVLNEATGLTRFTLKTNLTGLLPPKLNCFYDVVLVDEDGEEHTKTEGQCNIARDVGRRTTFA